MNTREIATEYRLSRWTQKMQERNESGLSAREFCKNRGIRENTFYYWMRKLRAAVIEAAPAIMEGPQQALTMKPVFAELKLAPRATALPPSGGLENQICIEAAGVRLTAGSEYPTEKLAELLRAVMRPCC